MEGLMFGGVYLALEICVIKSIELSLWLDGKYKKKIRTVLALFCLYLRAISKYKVPVTYIRSGDLTEGF